MTVVRVVNNYLDPLISPNGVLLANTDIVFQLVDVTKRQAAALFDALDGSYVVGNPVTATTDGAAYFTVNLWPNSRGEYATCYKVTLPNTNFKPIYIQVTEGEGDLTFLAARTNMEAMTPQTETIFGALLASITAALATATAPVTDTTNGLMLYSDKIKLDKMQVYPPTDIRYWMDGQSGRPLYTTWQASPSTTDVSTVLQAAVNGCGGLLTLPPGDYYCPSQVNLVSNLRIVGAGKTTRIFNTVGGWQNAPNMLVAFSKANITIEQIYIQNSHWGIAFPPAGTFPSTMGINLLFADCDNVKVVNCYASGGGGHIGGFDQGIAPIYFSRCRGALAHGNTVWDSQNGVLADDWYATGAVSSGVVFTDNTIYNMGRTGIVIDLSGGGRFEVQGNAVKQFTQQGICINNAVNGAVVGNSIDGDPTGRTQTSTATGEQTTWNGLYGIRINEISTVETSNVVVAENAIINVRNGAILAYDLSNSDISHNTISNCVGDSSVSTAAGIRMYSSGLAKSLIGISVTANQISLSPAAGAVVDGVQIDMYDPATVVRQISIAGNTIAGVTGVGVNKKYTGTDNSACTILGNTISGQSDNAITGVSWNGIVQGRIEGNITSRCLVGMAVLNSVKTYFNNTSDSDVTGLAITNSNAPIIDNLFIGCTTAMTFAKTGADNVKGDARGSRYIGVTTVKSRTATGAMVRFNSTAVPALGAPPSETGDIAINTNPSSGGPASWVWSDTNSNWIPAGLTSDANNNVGIAGMPKSWGGLRKGAVDLTTIAVANNGSAGGYLVANAYHDGSNWLYKTTNTAAIYHINSSGQHVWSNAVSGTAGTAVTFTTALTVDTAGHLTAAGNLSAANLSGSNTGDETTATIKTKLGITTLSGSNTGDQDLSGYAPLASPTFTGTPAAPTAAADTTTTQLATTAFVLGQVATTTPVVTATGGTGVVGTSKKYARADHAHPKGDAVTVNGYGTSQSGAAVSCMVTDGNGNLGLGTTPDTWASANRAIQVGFSGAIFASTSSTATSFANNVYDNGIARYRTSNAAALYQQSGAGHYWFNAPTGTAGAALTWALALSLDSTGALAPGIDNTQTCGSAAKRWSTLYAGTGTINTSDAREKTAVQVLTDAEISAASALSKEIGTYRFLSAIAEKGEAARFHVGMTVQRAIEIIQSFGLDPFKYGFICHDEWGADADTGTAAGDRYSFRPDELLFFIARGIEARLTVLENR